MAKHTNGVVLDLGEGKTLECGYEFDDDKLVTIVHVGDHSYRVEERSVDFYKLEIRLENMNGVYAARVYHGDMSRIFVAVYPSYEEAKRVKRILNEWFEKLEGLRREHFHEECEVVESTKFKTYLKVVRTTHT